MSVRFPVSGIPIRAARWSATHPWRAIGAWLAFVAAAVALAATISTQSATEADYRVGESGRAEAMVAEAGLAAPSRELVLITGAEGDPDAEAASAAAAAIDRGMQDVEGVAAVADPVWSEDRSALLVPVVLADEDPEVDVDRLLAVTDRVAEDHPGLELRQSGGKSVDAAINERVGEDLLTAELTSVPITLLLMLLAFGALIAAGIPVLLGATSVAATIGIAAPISHFLPAESTVTSMIVLIGMAVGVDYSLFYLKREREERAAGRTDLDAVEIAAETSGHAIVVSGGAVVAALAGLFLMTDVTFNSLATGAITVVAVAVLGSITVLPALLALLGPWVDRPRIPLLWRLNRRIGRGGISRRLLDPVLRHPVAALVAGSVAIVALAAPAVGMKIHEGTLATLPQDLGPVATMQAIEDTYPSEGAGATVVVEHAASERAEVGSALAALRDAAAATEDFAPGDGEVTVAEDGRTSMLELGMPFDGARAEEAVQRLRSDLAPDLLEGPGASYAVGGGVASSLDYTDKLGQRLPLVLGVVLLLTLLMLMRAFRSVPIALVSTVLNLASAGAAFGLLTIVFQHGVGASLLDFTNPGFVIVWIPLIVLVILVGLSMDYHVFVLSRIKEYVDRGLPTRLAVRRGVIDTAGTVTSAAAVMVSVFSLFAVLSMMEMKMMGVGLAGAILLDATLVRLVLLPAALVLLGDRAWWPTRPVPPVDRVVPAESVPHGAGGALTPSARRG